MTKTARKRAVLRVTYKISHAIMEIRLLPPLADGGRRDILQPQKEHKRGMGAKQEDAGRLYWRVGKMG